MGASYNGERAGRNWRGMMAVGGARGSRSLHLAVGFCNSEGLFRGLLIAWDTNYWEAISSSEGHHFISCLLRHWSSDKVFRLVNVYGPPQRSGRESFWTELVVLLSDSDAPMVVGGDFNITLGLDEQQNCRGCPTDDALFSSLIADSAFFDLPLSGRRFTWSNNHSSPAMARLDRILINDPMERLNANWRVRAGCSGLSDHAPLTLVVNRRLKVGIFRMEQYWVGIESFTDVMKDCWAPNEDEGNFTTIDRWLTNTKKCRAGLGKWSRNLKLRSNSRIVVLEKQMEDQLLAMEGADSADQDSANICAIREELDNYYQTQHVF
ncbi:retrotransposon protein [Canna indica]|uniref:Retrotransposon protein n=1 Tax=Canna indica TaxID=4628 RepID=A0AAQ3Q3E4_9LILI|nr:retrotransposon protein [Canna indica]